MRRGLDHSFFDRKVRRLDFAAFDNPVEVDHPQIRGVRFLTQVDDPVNDWADILVDLKDWRTYTFTVYTPTMIATDLDAHDEEYSGLHNDTDQLIVSEITVPCIVDGVTKILQMGCIDRMGVLSTDETIQEIEWAESVPVEGTRLIVTLEDGRRFRFTTHSIDWIARELQKPHRLSFVEDGLLVAKALDNDSIKAGLEKMAEDGLIHRVGVLLTQVDT